MVGGGLSIISALDVVTSTIKTGISDLEIDVPTEDLNIVSGIGLFASSVS